MSVAFDLMIGPRKVWESGRYEGVHNSVYHDEIDALNMSTLKLMDTSPAHCRHTVLNPDLHREMTKQKQDNLNFGSAIHTIILEPEKFETEYHAHPEGNKNSNAYKEKAAVLLAEGFILLEQKVIDRCHAIADHIHETPSHARDLIRAATATEVTYVVDGPLGMQCKLRPDLMVADVGLVVDLKSTLSASAYKFAKQLTDLGYHLSKPWYMDLLEVAEPGKWKQHLFLCVEKEPPFEFGLFDLDPPATELARTEVNRLASEYEACLRNNEWPGYPRAVQSVGVTGYEYQRVEREGERRLENA